LILELIFVYWQELAKVTKIRERREDERKEELEKQKEMELTQEATAAKKQDMVMRDDSQKGAMKRLHKIAKEKGGAPKKKIGKKRKKEENKQTEGGTMEAAQPTVQQAKGNASEAMETKNKDKCQGQRKDPKPSNEHGFSHSGLLELMELPRKYLEMYVWVGGWLYQRPCKDCALHEENQDEAGTPWCWMCLLN
jgi:hypothetical protein